MKTPTLRISLLVVAFLAFMPLQAVWSGDTLIMAFTDSPEEDRTLRYLELIYTEAFQRLGMEFAYKVYPMVRCGVMANSGVVDGLPARILNTNLEFPNLIQVDVSVITFPLSAFSTNPKLNLDGWESIGGDSYNVEYILGSPQSKAQLSKIVPSKRLSVVPTVDQALKKLIVGRTDSAVGFTKRGVSECRNSDGRNDGKYSFVPVLTQET